MSAETKFTPGPWVVIESGLRGDSYLVCVDVPGRLRPICAAEHGDPAAEANARLIATAPELLAGVREALAVLDLAEHYGLYEHGSLGDADVKDCRIQLRRAHHAATGTWATPIEVELGGREELFAAEYAPPATMDAA